MRRELGVLLCQGLIGPRGSRTLVPIGTKLGLVGSRKCGIERSLLPQDGPVWPKRAGTQAHEAVESGSEVER